METKQTAVDWLIDELGEYFPHEIGGIHLMVKQAKQMEKEQIMKAYLAGESDGDHLINSAKLYFKKTYGPQVDKK